MSYRHFLARLKGTGPLPAAISNIYIGLAPVYRRPNYAYFMLKDRPAWQNEVISMK